MKEWIAWLQRTTGETSARGIARKVGRSHTTVIRWQREGVPPDAVVDAAIALDADVFEALVAAGWLSPEEVSRVNLDVTLRQIKTVRLTAELHRRAIEKERRRGGT